MSFPATYFDGLSTRAHAVRVTVTGESLTLHGDEANVSVPLSRVRIEPALGRTRRVLEFPEGARLETDALETVAGLERTLGQNRELRLTGWLEAHWGRVVGCLAGLTVVVAAAALYGIPWGARVAAFATPPGVLEGASERSLRLLDDRVLEPSRLGVKRRATLLAARCNATPKPARRSRLAQESRGPKSQGHRSDSAQGEVRNGGSGTPVEIQETSRPSTVPASTKASRIDGMQPRWSGCIGPSVGVLAVPIAARNRAIWHSGQPHALGQTHISTVRVST